MKEKYSPVGILFLGFLLLLLVMAAGFFWAAESYKIQTNRALQPLEQANLDLKTQVARILNPTPTIIPDPITIVREVRSLAKLETIQYTIQKIISAESGQGPFGFLFGDRLLLVAHGKVIAGSDLNKLKSNDIWFEGRVLIIRLPEPEIFIATLDNEKTHIYDRGTGILKQPDRNLETKARQAAESEILKAAVEDGILRQAKINTENYLARLLRAFGFLDIRFEYQPPPL